MRCIGCGQTIEGEPFWVDDGPYCSPECAEEFAFDGELDEEEEWEEELET
jgi:hypothetical protein